MISDAQAGQPHAVKALAKAPQVEDRYQFYWLAFQELGTERQSQGMSSGPIPVSAIKRFCEDEELDPLESEALTWIVRTVDAHQRKKADEKIQKEQNTKAKVRR